MAKIKKTLSRSYRIYHGIKARCYNPKELCYKNYGGRGIVMCARWLESFDNFFADMGESPAGTSIERKDVNGNYEPENCCWATPKAQCRNQRRTVLVEYEGMKMTISEVAELTGVHYQTLHNRNRNGLALLKKHKTGPKPNTCNAISVIHDGQEMSLSELSKISGVNIYTLYYRRRKGLPLLADVLRYGRPICRK